MKKVLYSIGILAISALAFSSCEKETATKDEPVKNLVTISFTAEKAGLGTKTAAVEGAEDVSFIWTDEDVANIKLFPVTDGKAGEAIASPTVTKVSDTKLTISTEVEPNATYTFRAVLAGKWTNNTNKPRLSDEQSPKADNFDPTADVLISDDLTIEVGEEETSTGDRLMTFRRQVVNNKMTLKNLTEGEKIDKVVITSTANLSGYFDLDTQKSTGEKKVLTLNYNKAYTVDATKTFPVYFTSLEGAEQSLTVEVTTDKYIYTKSFAEGKSINFNLGEFTKFNFALPAGVPNTASALPFEYDFRTATLDEDEVTAGGGYTSASESGLRLASGNNDGYFETKSLVLSSDFVVALTVKPVDSGAIISVSDGSNSAFKTITTSRTEEYTEYFTNEGIGSNAKLRFTVAAKNRVDIIKVRVISGSVLPPVIDVTSDNPMDIDNGSDLGVISYTITRPVDDKTISAVSDVDWIHDFEYASGEVGFEYDAQEAGAEAREGHITLSYENAEDVVVTVNQAAGEGGSTTYTYVFTNKDWNATLNGATANWTNDKSATSFESASTARGVSIQKAETGAGATSPISYSGISNIKISLAKSNKGAGSVSVKVGETQVGTVSSFNTTSTESSFDVSNLSGKVTIVVTCTTSTLYVKEISITSGGSASGGETPSTYSVNIAEGISGGKVEASKTEGISEGESVILTITPNNSGYELETLTVDGSNVTSSVADGKYTFNMPAKDVAVSATFKKTESGDGDIYREFQFSDKTKNGLSSWPTSAGSANSTQTYTDDSNNTYSFTISSYVFEHSSGYLFMQAKTAKAAQYISIPNVSGYSVKSVEITAASGASASATGVLTSDMNGTDVSNEGTVKISKSETTTWTVKTSASQYYFSCNSTGYNAQVTKIKVTYSK